MLLLAGFSYMARQGWQTAGEKLMATLPNLLIQRLDAVCDLQTKIPCLITGFYLDDVEISSIASWLSTEDIWGSMVGRYDHVPIFRKCAILEKDRGEIGEYEGVVYSYGVLDVVN